jgi:hypothetical protein
MDATTFDEGTLAMLNQGVEVKSQLVCQDLREEFAHHMNQRDWSVVPEGFSIFFLWQ